MSAIELHGVMHWVNKQHLQSCRKIPEHKHNAKSASTYKFSTVYSIARLASPIISTAFRCDNCTTANFSTPVQVTFRHQPYDEVCYIY